MVATVALEVSQPSAPKSAPKAVAHPVNVAPIFPKKELTQPERRRTRRA